jgi:hypothetical protein
MKTLKLIAAAVLAFAFLGTANANNPGKGKNAYSLGANELNEALQANVPDQTGFHIGIRYQPVFGNLDVNTAGGNQVSASMQASHGFALSLNYYFNNWIGTHLEAMYARHTYEYDDAGATRRVNMSYLSFPVMASLNTNFGRGINFNIAAGPYLGVSLGADTDVDANGGQAEATVNVNTFDFGVAYGGGLDFAFGVNHGVHIRVGYRGTTGLIDLADSGVQTGGNQVTVIAEGSRIQTHGAYLGLMFKL